MQFSRGHAVRAKFSWPARSNLSPDLGQSPWFKYCNKRVGTICATSLTRFLGFVSIQAVEQHAEADADPWLMTYRQVMQTAFHADQVTVTGTGYFGASRREVRQLAWRLGAAYCGDLTHGVTTHLVCKDAAQPSTEKVKMAEAWGIPVVDHSWLLDSVARQTVMLTEKYAVVPLSTLAKGVSPATVTARSSKHRTAKHMLDKQLASSEGCQSHAADNEEVELLRAADSPTNCQLADLLLSTTLSPASGLFC